MLLLQYLYIPTLGVCILGAKIKVYDRIFISYFSESRDIQVGIPVFMKKSPGRPKETSKTTERLLKNAVLGPSI